MSLISKLIPIFLMLSSFMPEIIKSQVLISAAPGTPASTSIVDITSTTKGLLIPRMSTTERNAIVTPATGLMIYNTVTSAFNYWSGTAWIAMAAGNIKELSDSDGDSKVEVERTPNENVIHFKAGGSDIAAFNSKSLQIYSPTSSCTSAKMPGIVRMVQHLAMSSWVHFQEEVLFPVTGMR